MHLFETASGGMWLIKTDSKGNKEWDKTFGVSNCASAYSVKQTTDKGYILAGDISLPEECCFEFWLIKTDSHGDIEWDKTFGGFNHDFARSVQQTSDGGYILTGYTSSFGGSDLWLIKTGPNGDIEWDKIFGGNLLDRGYSVRQTSDDGFILTGMTASFGAGNSDLWIIKTGPNGNKEWDKTFGGINNDNGFSIRQTADEGYIIAGMTASFGAGDYDFWLIKLKGNVETPVNENQLPTTFSLLQNYPNPFNISTIIQCLIPEPSSVELTIYNLQGQTVRTINLGNRPAGIHNVLFDGKDSDGTVISAGLYLYKIQAGDFSQTKKMLLLK